ncbi:MAG: hypothetical protein KAY03_05605, partial [Arenimonas sp.]|nr:hypothetical protein [Arenimonas sp.]
MKPGESPPSSSMATTAASAASYTLTVPPGARRSLALGWLWLGLIALIVSGVYSVLLVLSRTPGVNRLLPVADFFRVALVVHVDLSVLVWFVSLAGMLWSLNGRRTAIGVGWAALALAAAGASLMALAPFVGHGTPIMANYVPVLDDQVFLAGLAIFAGGGALLV